ncbi:MAG: DUF1572 family protein [Bacteroidetes bacterium]|nr:DUF1572 family protein [Bacteroidota bacterium]
MTTQTETNDQFCINFCREKLTKEYFNKISACMKLLSDDDIWWRAHETNNSVGNLILHLTGNVRQWIVQYLGGNEFQRNRVKEFSERNKISGKELSVMLESALNDAGKVLEKFPLENLKKQYTIQNFTVTGLEAILHVTEHFSYHVGQIVYITKLRTGKDLQFYNL